MSDYTVYIQANDTWTVYAVVVRGKEVIRQIVKFAPGLNTPENVLSVALSDILVRIERAGKKSRDFSLSVPELLDDDTVFEKVSLFGNIELRIENEPH